MAKFKNTDPNQLRMHVLDFQELFGEGHPIHGFKKVMERLDFEDFDKNYQNDATGRPADLSKESNFGSFLFHLNRQSFDERTLQVIKTQGRVDLSLGWRRIRSYVYFQVSKGTFEDLFSQTVFLGYESGFIDFETISIDGTKIKANANPDDLGDLERFEKRLKQIEEVSKTKFKEWEKSADLDSSKIQKKRKELERKTDKLKEAVEFLKKHKDRRRIHLFERNCDLTEKRKRLFSRLQRSGGGRLQIEDDRLTMC